MENRKSLNDMRGILLTQLYESVQEMMKKTSYRDVEKLKMLNEACHTFSFGIQNIKDGDRVPPSP